MSSQFLFIFGTIIAGNSFIFANVYAAFGRGKWLFIAGPWFALMCSSLFIHAWVNYTGPVYETLTLLEGFWLPYAFTLILIFFVVDVGLGARWIVRTLRGLPPNPGRSLAKIIKIVCGLALFFTAYGAYEAHSPRPVFLTITTPKLPANAQRLRVAFVSDMHINNLIGPRLIGRVTGVIQAQKPDIIILGGDTVDGIMKNRHAELALLQKLQARYGKFAVLGNHDVAYGIRQSCDFLEKAGFTMLRHSIVKTAGIVLAGVDDPHAAKQEGTRKHDPATLLQTLTPEERAQFVLLIKHRPTAWEPSLGLFDVQLSGHSHGGQIWPARYLIEVFFGVKTGYSEHDSARGRSSVFVSVGSGYAKTPLRFLTPPEIVIVDIVPGEAVSHRYTGS